MLTVTETLDLGEASRLTANTDGHADRVDRMRREGVFTAQSLFAHSRLARMRAGIDAVRERLGHEVFALLFDEFWITLAETTDLLEPVLGTAFRVVPMPYVNHVPPGSAGFGAHRDRFDDPVTADGLPNMVTAWISLTDAGPERACLSVLPACHDRCFPDELSRLEIRDVRDIRALPVPAGSLVCFNQAVVHWGTRNASSEARVSFAFELERHGLADARSPSIDLAEPLSFDARLGFVGAVIGQLSKNNVQFTPTDLDIARRMCERVHGSTFAACWAM
jgi:hypothetical protein